MKRKPISWTTVLKQIFSPVRRKPVSTRLAIETLDERIVPASYSPNPNALDGATGSLRADITAANNDTTANAVETFNLTSAATYTLTIANPPDRSRTKEYRRRPQYSESPRQWNQDLHFQWEWRDDRSDC